jgi:hypothetical protein
MYQHCVCRQSRYVLVLMENYAAFNILDEYIAEIKNYQVIFGSSFPKDQEYTQVSVANYTTIIKAEEELMLQKCLQLL